MTPSKNEPTDPLLLSPPMPRMIAPCLVIGRYPDWLGSAPLYRVASPPDCALPSLMAYVEVPLFFRTAVTKALLRPVLAVHEPLPPANRPFSRSAATRGPAEQGENQHRLPK